MAVHVLRENISLQHRRLKSEPIPGVHRHTHAGHSHRAGLAPIGEVHVGERGPAKSGVQKKSAVFGNQKLGVGRKLAEADRNSVLEEVLLEPHFEHPKRVEARRVRDREKIPDQILAGIAPAQPQPSRARARALPANRLLEIHLRAKIQPPRVNSTSLDSAACVSPHLSRVAAENRHPVIGQLRILGNPLAEDLVALQQRQSGISILRAPSRNHQKNSERKTARTNGILNFHRERKSQILPRRVDQIATVKEAITRYRVNQGLK